LIIQSASAIPGSREWRLLLGLLGKSWGIRLIFKVPAVANLDWLYSEPPYAFESLLRMSVGD